MLLTGVRPALAQNCTSPPNPIVAENCQTGTPQSTWDLSGSSYPNGDPSIQGFATDISVNAGSTISFKVNTTATATLYIYRMGYYQGNGARLVTTITPSVKLPQTQPACITDSTTDLIDCGNWAVSASWAVPSTAVSGVYFVLLKRTDTGGESHIFFVVRNDSGTAPILFQTSDPTWEAYNMYGGVNFYGCNDWDITCRSFKVSYNRPANTRGFQPYSWVMNAEYPMIRWLEANGYNLAYMAGMDTDRYGSLLTNHQVFLSVGHDEYWSANQRANVNAARAAGVNLAFFSGNEMFWKTRWENSIDGTNTPYRTLVCYKETFAGEPIDPDDPPTWTGTWRDPSFSPPADGGNPENGTTGTLFMMNSTRNDSIIVPYPESTLRLWRNTAVASLKSGNSYTFPAGTLGYEWDIDADNGFRPAGLFDVSTSNETTTDQLLLDYGTTYGAGNATHHVTMYRYQGKALVFGAGTVQWAWGLDASGDEDPGGTTDVNLQQATVNLLADMGVQPGSIQSGLTAATKSTDTKAPTSVITSPTSGASTPAGTPVTITGTATDAGGGVVAGIEVSYDGGNTWHPATGTTSWSYVWTPSVGPTATLRSRATDDSGNIETPSAGVTVNVSGLVSISVTPSTATVLPGATLQYTATGTFQGGTTQNISSSVTWTSSKTAVATVSSAGLATGVGTGTSTLTASSGSISGTATVTVPALTSISVSPSVPILPVNTTQQFAATGTYSGGGTQTITSQVAWTSGTTSVATISSGGLATAVSAGTSTITATMGSVSGNTTLTVQATGGSQCPCTIWSSTTTPGTPDNGADNPVELGVAFQATTSGAISGVRFYKASTNTGTHVGNLWSSTGTLLASATFTNETSSGWQQVSFSSPVTITAGTTYIASYHSTVGHWSGDRSYFATKGVTSTPLLALENGSTQGNGVYAYNSASTFPANTYLSTNYWVDVVFIQPNVLTSIAVTPTSSTILPTTTQQMTATGTYEGGGTQNITTQTTWTSSNTAVATVSSTGIVTAVGAGSSTITATLSGVSGTTTVTVPALSSIAVTPANPSVLPGGTQQFVATGTYVGGGTETITGQVTWSSGTTSVATINSSSGLATMTGVGSSTITAKQGSITGTTTLTVPPLLSIAVTPAAPTINVAATQQFTATGTYQGGGTQNITSQVTWSSSNTSVATISSSGLATALLGGTSTISAVESGVTGENTVSGATTLTVEAPVGSQCPCTIWSSTTTPGTPDNGADNPVELGVAFQATTSGAISGVRFYKASTNTGTHVGNLWSSTGTLLASATFTNETSSGWQQVSFSSPVTITAGTTYIASYHTTVGHWSGDRSYFASTGVSNPPLQALQNGSSQGDGVYAYGSTSIFPTSSYLSTNYWVDVVFIQPNVLTSIGVTPTTPTLLPGATQQMTATGTYQGGSTQNITSSATWTSSNTAVATVNSTGIVTAVGAGSSTITATLSGVSGTTTVTVPALSSIAVTPANPSVLPGGTQQFVATGTYVGGGTETITGQVTWSSGTTSVATINSSSGLATAVNSGSSTISATQGSVTGTTTLTVPALSSIAVTPANPSVLPGGTQQFVATGTYVGGGTETITGQVTWSSGTTSVATINSSSGLATAVNSGSSTISATQGSVTGTTTLTVPALSSIAITPAAPTINVNATQQFTATGTYVGGGTQNISSQVTWGSSNTSVATITTGGLATALLAGSTTISGVQSGITGSTTLSVQGSAYNCPCTIWSSSTVPSIPDNGPDSSVELGVLFEPTVNGTITGVRFYKASTNTGTHVGNLWSSTGTLLATVTFTNETSSGWQQMSFSSPVTVTAGTIYIASYHTTVGHWSVNRSYFASSGVNNPPLQALQSVTGQGNGVYMYGSTSSFPTNTFQASNYWVDVVFQPSN
jgi:uncharacterized protein YjdB